MPATQTGILGCWTGGGSNSPALTDLRDRGLDVTRPVLAVIDGSKALAAAIKAVFDKPVIQRCQEHKIRNVIDKLPDRMRQVTQRRLHDALREIPIAVGTHPLLMS